MSIPPCFAPFLLASSVALAGPPDALRDQLPPRAVLGPERFANGRIALKPPPPGLLALTFDDGPSAATTPAILATLAHEGVTATFFVNAYRLGGHSETARRQREILVAEVERGHLVGNHTFDHRRLSDLDGAAQAKEILDGESGMARVLGERTWLFRPPYGRMSEPAARLLGERGYTVVLWNISSEDPFLRTPEKVLAAVMADLRRTGGGVALFHDTHPWTVAALPLFFAALAEENCHRVAAGVEPILVVPLDRFFRPRYAEPPAAEAIAADAGATQRDLAARRRIAAACGQVKAPSQGAVVDENKGHPR